MRGQFTPRSYEIQQLLGWNDYVPSSICWLSALYSICPFPKLSLPGGCLSVVIFKIPLITFILWVIPLLFFYSTDIILRLRPTVQKSRLHKKWDLRFIFFEIVGPGGPLKSTNEIYNLPKSTEDNSWFHALLAKEGNLLGYWSVAILLSRNISFSTTMAQYFILPLKGVNAICGNLPIQISILLRYGQLILDCLYLKTIQFGRCSTCIS